MKRHAHAVMRIHPLHLGHTAVLNRMNENYETWSIGLGSTGRHSEPGHPWTQAQRTEMLRNVYGNRVKIVPLEDIGAEQGKNTWCEYVLSKAEKIWPGAPITDYFTGSHADAMWYKGLFWHGAEDDPLLQTPEYQKRYFTKEGVLRRLHILERSETIFPSATEVRTFLATRSDEWKRWVPGVNHQLVESTYPEHFKIKIEGE